MRLKHLFRIFTIVCAVAIGFKNQGVCQNNIAPGVALFNGNLGLNQNTITCIYAQRNGQMWVSTFGGLHLFDGHKFRLIPFPEHLQFSSIDVIRGILESGDSLLLSTETSIISYHPKTGKFHSIISGNTNTFLLLKVDQNQLFYYDFADGSLKTLHLKSRTVSIIYRDGLIRQSYDVCYASGKLYLSDLTNTIVVLDLHEREPREIKIPGKIRQLLATDDNNCIVLTDSHVLLWSENTITKLREVPVNDYLIYAEKDDSEILFLTQSAWYRYDFRAHKLNVYEESDFEIPSYLLGRSTKLFKDVSGNYWLGKDGYGLLRFNRLIFAFNRGQALGTRGKFVRTIYESHSRLWAGTHFSELLEITDTSVVSHAFPSTNQKGSIHAIDSIDENTLLVASDLGLWTFLIDKGKFENFQDCLPNSIEISFQRIGNRWISYASYHKQFMLFEIQNNKIVLSETIEFDELVRCIKPLSEHKILLSLYQGGLSIFDLKTRKQEILPEFNADKIIHISYGDSLWFMATTEGVIRTNQSFQKLGSDNNVEINTHCYSIIPLSQSEYWVGTNTGLIHFHKNTSNTYSALHGLQGDEFNGRCALRLKNGRLAFGGVNGISIFDPAQIMPDTVRPIPTLEFCRNEGKPLDINILSNTVNTFLEGQLNMQFHFNLTNYTFSDKNELAIALVTQGSNDTLWQELKSVRDYYLVGLGANNYQIIAKAGNADGVWGNVRQIAQIRVTPIFYKTWWFISTAILAAFLLTLTMIYLYIARRETRRKAEHLKQKALSEMRQQIADDIHDDLGAGLTKLSLMAEKVAQSNTEIAAQIKPISSSVRKLSKTLNEVIWATNPENDNIAELQRHLVAMISEMVENTDIKLVLDLNESSSLFDINPFYRQNILHIVRETVHNCIKHAHAKTFYFNIKCDANALVIYMKDDGIGFNTNDHTFGNGSQTQLRRAEAIGAQFRTISSPGGPTETTLVLAYDQSKN